MKTIFLSFILALATATVFASTQTQATQDKPWRIYQLGATMNASDYIHSIRNDYYYPDPQATLFDTIDSTTIDDKDFAWVSGLGGYGSANRSTKSTTTDIFWTGSNYDTWLENNSIDFDWSGLGYDDHVIGSSGSDQGQSYSGYGTNEFYINLSSYVAAYEHCDVIDSAHPPFGTYGYYSSSGPISYEITTTENYQRYAQATWHVQTGGKSIPGKQNLWQISGWANEILDKRAAPPPYGAGNNIPSTLIAIGELGNLKADGTLWLTLPDDTDMDITPKVAENDFYTFGVGGQKYAQTIFANTNDLSSTIPEFCVGQSVTFSANWTSVTPFGEPPVAPPATNIDNEWWHLPGTFVNESYPYSSTCTSYRENDDLLTNATTQCWFVNGSGGGCSFRQTLHFSNGQSVNVAVAGNFTIFRPTVSAALNDNTTPSFFADVHGAIPGIQLGGDDDPRDGLHSMNYTVTYDTTSGSTTYTGLGGTVQLLTANFSARPSKTFSDWRLDGNTVIYNGVGDPINPLLDPPQDAVEFSDSPKNYQPFIFSTIWVIGSFQDYCMFKPDGDGNIYVNLGTVTWSCDGEVRPSNIGEPGFPDALIITTNQVSGPTGPDSSDAFPQWQNTCPE